MSTPILSLCIPTNGKLEWIIPVLNSIYSQSTSLEKYEVIVVDNGENNNEVTLKQQFNYLNFKYYKSKESGFLNQIYSFTLATGIYIKMINHRSCLQLDSINQFLEIIEKYKHNKPILYFSDNVLKSKTKIIEFPNYNEFASKLGYWLSWSCGFGIWKEDLSKIKDISPDKMFPHFSLIFDIRENSKCVVYDGKFQDMLDDTGKGGYDLFYTFGIIFWENILKILNSNKISKETAYNIKHEIKNFLSYLYATEVICKSKHTFIIQNVKESILKYFSRKEYYSLIFKSYIIAFKVKIKQYIKFLYKHH